MLFRFVLPRFLLQQPFVRLPISLFLQARMDDQELKFRIFQEVWQRQDNLTRQLSAMFLPLSTYWGKSAALKRSLRKVQLASASRASNLRTETNEDSTAEGNLSERAKRKSGEEQSEAKKRPYKG